MYRKRSIFSNTSLIRNTGSLNSASASSAAAAEEVKIFREGSIRVKSATTRVASAKEIAAAAEMKQRAKENAAGAASAAVWNDIPLAEATATQKEIAAAVAGGGKIASAASRIIYRAVAFGGIAYVAVQRSYAAVQEAIDAKVCVYVCARVRV